MSLEVDTRHYVSPGLNHTHLSDKHSIRMNSMARAVVEVDDGSKNDVRGRPARGRLPAMLSLTIALVVTLFATLIGLGITASLAVKRQHRIDELTTASTSSSSPIPGLSMNTSTPTTAACLIPAPPDKSSTSIAHPPSRDCSAMNNPYTSTNLSSTIFGLECGIDIQGKGNDVIDLMGIFAYSFEDCLGACVTYNNHPELKGDSHCYAVSYDTTMQWPTGNCFLKASQDYTVVKKSVTDSAVVSADG